MVVAARISNEADPVVEQPNKHHFLPVFYLSQWAGKDGRLVQFSRPYREAKPLRRHPKAIGYIEKLYTVEGLPPDLASAMETEFLSPVDSKAAEALAVMMDTGRVNDLTGAQRLAWTAFMNSLLVRMPDDIRKLKIILGKTVDLVIPFVEAIYHQVRAIGLLENGLPASGADLLAPMLPGLTSKSAMERARDLINDPLITSGIAGMEWRIRTLGDIRNELLTSDRPIAISRALNAPDSHLAMPLGPNTVFLAFRDVEIADRVSHVSDDQLAVALNRYVVQNAVSFVYGRTDGQLRFVQNRMGVEREASFMDRLVELAHANLAPMPNLADLVDLDEFARVAKKAYAEGLAKRQSGAPEA